MHVQTLVSEVRLTLAGELEKGRGVSTKAKWRTLERPDFSLAVERTVQCLRLGRRRVQEQRRMHHEPRLSASLAEIEHQHETKRWGVGLRYN